MKYDWLRTVPMRCLIVKKDGCGILYVKDDTEMLRKPVKFCGKDDIAFHLRLKNALSRASFPSMTTKYIQTEYEEVKKKVL